MDARPGLPGPGDASCAGRESCRPPGELAPLSILAAMSSWLCSLATMAVRSASCSPAQQLLHSHWAVWEGHAYSSMHWACTLPASRHACRPAPASMRSHLLDHSWHAAAAQGRRACVQPVCKLQAAQGCGEQPNSQSKPGAGRAAAGGSNPCTPARAGTRPRPPACIGCSA